ncbi:MAG: kynureninase, partial [Chitinophagaceae bacterium]|nr:kynureninase [Chitinophagaceae bacterium]
MEYQLTDAYAYQMDEQDELAYLKKEFFFPDHNGAPVIYFCGNSLGLQPKSASAAIDTALNTWRNMAVGGYFGGATPWLSYHEQCVPGLLPWLGAKPHEVTVMNALTVNLHLAMVSFYRPSGKRTKIIMEAGAFPSDQYAVETQVLHHGLNPEAHIIQVKPREGEKLLRHHDILAAIAQAGDTLALCLFSGMNYYTGQLYNISEITAAAHAAGAFAAFDLAHVVGNVPVQLHDAGVDFAVWCSYKYLNGGPGAVGGFYVHEKHGQNTDIPRFGGWWGNDEKTRFKMEKGFIPREGASGWCLSTSQVFNTVCLKASLELLHAA